jgi:hypothetical protein
VIVVGAQLFCGMSSVTANSAVTSIAVIGLYIAYVMPTLLVLGAAGIWWLVSARKWYRGPKVQGTPEELAAIEADLQSV